MTAPTPISLSFKEARKLVLLAQGINRPSYFGKGLQGTQNAIDGLGYIQIDTISVVERAHHHTLWNRNKSYTPEHLTKLQRDGHIFEYWAHAAAYLPMRDFRFSLPRKKAFAAGDSYWHAKDPKVAKRVMDRIRAEGPLQARNFDEKRVGQHAWGGMKPAKIQLERLFMEGELMIAKRDGFNKVFDLTERVLPSSVSTREPTKAELCEHLVRQTLAANAIATPAEITYLRKGLKPVAAKICKQMVEQGDLVELRINDLEYLALPEVLSNTSTPLSRSKVAILSPFDNLLIQRKRTQSLFKFDYLIECYVTAAKRKYGYFSLPLLWGHNFAGRMDAKIDRKTGVFHVFHLALETNNLREFSECLRPSLHQFLKFNGGQNIEVHRISSAFSNHSQKDLDALKLLLV